MFDLLQHPPRSPEPAGVGASVSIMTHAALVLMLALGTSQATQQLDEAQDSLIETAIRYLLPPDKGPSTADDATTVPWESLRAGQQQASDLSVANGTRVPRNNGADAPQDQDGSAPLPLAEAATALNAFTIIDVDSAAARDPDSAAPAYPTLLQAQGIEGAAVVRFVVDTTGRADLGTFQLIETNHRLFAAAVREALPGMKFVPARIGALKVRQLVELPFAFRIVRLAPPSTRKP